jgi:hypothetical protein
MHHHHLFFSEWSLGSERALLPKGCKNWQIDNWMFDQAYGQGMEYLSAAQSPTMAPHRGNRVVNSSPTRRRMMMPVLLFLPSTASFEPSCRVVSSVPRLSHRGSTILAASDDNNNDRQGDHKRFIIASALAIIPYFGWEPQFPIMALPPAAHALQEKSELLCNT